MQSILFTHRGQVQLEDRPLPIPETGEVRLRVLLAGVCATDRHIVQGHFSVRTPRILGHELVGQVETLGAGVPKTWLGQSCGVLPARFCGECGPCRQGAPELCVNFECLGNTHDGGFAEYTVVPVEQLVRLGDLAPERAVWLEPLACVLQALDTVQDRLVGATVLVAGAGVLGRLMVQAARERGADRVALVDPNPEKVQAGLASGADAGWTIPRQGPSPEVDAALNHWAPEGPGVLIDTTGAPAAIERLVAWAGPQGVVLLFGVSDPEARLSINPSEIFAKELTLTASSGMAPVSFAAAEQMLRRGALDLDALVGSVVGLDALPEVLLNGTGMQAGKVLVQPGEGNSL